MILNENPKIEIILGDNMDYLRSCQENQFNLAIVDPPYGLGDTLIQGGTWSKKYQQKGAAWDTPPGKEYFDLLSCKSVNYIIWGGNYFTQFIKPARCFISWLKPNMSGMHTMADCELALTSFNQNAKVVKISSQTVGERIHVCQKPIKLYEWLLSRYASKGDKILDTHLGSGSSAIACYNAGYDFVGIEKDEEYYNAAVKRITEKLSQLRLAI